MYAGSVQRRVKRNKRKILQQGAQEVNFLFPFRRALANAPVISQARGRVVYHVHEEPTKNGRLLLFGVH